MNLCAAIAVSIISRNPESALWARISFVRNERTGPDAQWLGQTLSLGGDHFAPFRMLCALYSYSDFAFIAAFLWRVTLALELSHRAGSGQSMKGRHYPPSGSLTIFITASRL